MGRTIEIKLVRIGYTQTTGNNKLILQGSHRFPFSMMSSASFRQFSLENEMQDIDEGNDAIYRHDTEEQRQILAVKPWASK